VSFRQEQVIDPNNPEDLSNPPVIGEPITERYGSNYHKKTRYTCVLCGECDFGCNTGSKNTLDYTYITAAQHRGALIKPLCEVKSFAPLDGNGYQVTYIEHDPGKWGGQKVDTNDPQLFPPVTVTARRLIISAGTFGSPYLLFKNRAAFDAISPTLGSRFCVNGDLLSFITNSKQKKNGKSEPLVLDPSFGPVITSAIRLGDTLDGNADQGRGFYVEDGGNPYLMSWGVELTGFFNLLRRSAHFAESFLSYRLGFGRNADLDGEIATLLGDCATSKSSMPVLTMGRDIPNGALSFDGKYLNCDWEIKKSQEYYDRVIRIVKGIAAALNAKYMDNPSYEYLRQVITAHPLGGCPMGRDKSRGVVDSYGEVFGYPGLFVVDGSIMPGPVGPNPSMTIAAISDRAADHIIDQRNGGNKWVMGTTIKSAR
jgi:cholesterol oxidase